MTPWLTDPDLDLYVGDVRTVLAGLPDESVDCCVTSPPYWGLRDYGTGQWDGGDPDCDHVGETLGRQDAGRNFTGGGGNREGSGNPGKQQFRDVCGKCGARRVDLQLGLDPTPQEYVTNMVAVFAQVRRVLRPHGTLWLNLGDSYSQQRKAADIGLKPKDLVGVPWRVAFALQADGWYLRSDIVWSKPDPMPESVTDRPTKAHEYVFLLSKQPRYWFDQEAVREPHTGANVVNGQWVGKPAVNRPEWEPNTQGWNKGGKGGGMRTTHRDYNPAGRNVRSVWEIATQPYAEAHFATFPEELPRRCVLAGCPEWVCGTCGKARERIIEVEQRPVPGHRGRGSGRAHVPGLSETSQNYANMTQRTNRITTELGWSDCGHNNHQPGVVLDPFFGSGTTGLVARKHGRRTIGIELNPDYARLAARRLQQLSLLTEGSAA